MSYRNKTYVIFDGDKDIWAYGYMKGWKANDKVEFDFHDAHDLRPITDRASEETVKATLRARFSTAKQAVVLIGESTKNLYKFVRWEIEVAQRLHLPIIAVNLNNRRTVDYDRCPPILRNADAIHIAFKMKVIQYAMDDFAPGFSLGKFTSRSDWHYNDSMYRNLGIL